MNVAAILKWAAYFLAGNFGYSQVNRWTGLKNGKPSAPGDFDCTSIIGAILYLAGYLPLKLLQGTWYSGNLAGVLAKQGWRRVSAKGRSLAWLNANVVAGCVLVGPGHGVLGLGEGVVLSWEYSEHHTTKGTIGRQAGEIVRKRKLYLRSRGWTDLLIPPADKPDAGTVSQAVPLAFRAGQASQEAPHFGGKATGAQRGREIAKLGASVVGLSETQLTTGVLGSAKAAGLRAAIMAAVGRGWKRAAAAAVCLMWDGAKWSKGQVASVKFGARTADVWHYALAVKLWRRDAKCWITFVVVHVRPRSMYVSDAAADKGKAADVAAAIALGKKVAGDGPLVILGDFAMNADALMRAAGLTRASLDVDSWDTAGVQRIDAIYLDQSLAGTLAKAHDPGSISDHTWLSVRVTPAASLTV